MVHIPEYIHRLKPYIPGRPIEELALEKGIKRMVKLASNENPLGPSPKAMQAVKDAVKRFNRYGDPHAFELNHKMSKRLGVKPANIMFGAGVDAITMFIIATFSEPGDEILTSDGSFIGVYVNTSKLGRRLVTVPLNDFAYDLDAIAARIGPRTRIVYIANPNNPTGTIITHDQLSSFMKAVPKDVLVFLDEAYFTYASQFPEYPDGLAFLAENVIVTRSMSKDYGLAGFRVGYVVGSEELIGQMRKVKLTFEPSYPAQVAALAALDDDEHLRRTVETNRRSLRKMQKAFDRYGIRWIKSYANFLLMVFDDEEFAAHFTAACLDRGLILRHVVSFGLPNAVRINSGTDDETEFALEVIEDVHSQLKPELSTGAGV